ncbi:EVE domain-containing protein [Candidatus Nomurabacteria bacterium]|nr:EVE domain-containing protein [Candidatus Nomurabacteria bacterium]
MNHWLLKSEPTCYSIDDLARDGVTPWDGIRNYQARNFMRDDMRVGDEVFFYHSNTKPPHIAGIGRIASTPYPDPTQFDAQSEYYDPKATVEKPRWFLVDVAFVAKAKEPLSLPVIKNDPSLSEMLVIQKGQRLSIQPVSKKHFEYIKAIIV